MSILSHPPAYVGGYTGQCLKPPDIKRIKAGMNLTARQRTWRSLPALLFLSLATATVSAQTFTTLHSFTRGTGDYFSPGITNNDGASPIAGLILSSNTLYGAAQYGGDFGFGSVFKVNTDGSGFTNVHFFTGVNEGAYPIGSLIISGNTLFGTTAGNANQGGHSGRGTVFKVNTDGSGFTNLHIFAAGSDGADPWAGLILSGNTLYGTAFLGGSSDKGTVFAVNTDGTGFTNLHIFTGGSNDGAVPQAGLILSGSTLYGTTHLGGTADVGMVFKVNTDGSGFTNLHSFTATTGFPTIINSDGAYPVGSLVLSGNSLYGTTPHGGSSGAGAVFKVNTDGTGFTNLYVFYGSSDGTAPHGGLTLSGNTLYGTTSGDGGSLRTGAIFAINTDGSGPINLYKFSATAFPSPETNSDGASPLAQLILSGNTLYGTAAFGGGATFGTVFSLLLPPPAPPQLTDLTQPQSLVVTQGNNATFTVSAYGFPPPAYQWQFNSADITGATQSSYTKANVQASDAGSYSVVITNIVGTTNSGNAVLTVKIPPGISTQPTSLVLTQGNNATFSVVATGDATLGYQWKFNGGSISGATLTSYTRSNLLSGDAGSYSVTVTNGVGTSNSVNAILTVRIPPGISTQPTSLVRTQGNSATFTVTATGDATLGYQWQLNGDNVSGATQSSYTRSNLQSSDGGNYSVTVTNGVGATNSANAVLTVKISPSITTQPQNQIALIGSNVSFTVTAAGDATLGYQWRFNSTNISGATLTAYTISSAQLSNSGSYSVVVTNPVGSITSTSASLVVIPSTTLNYFHVGNSVVLSWPTNSSRWTLQSATDLPSANWLDVSGVPAIVGNQFCVTNNPAGSALFYRLRGN